MPVKRSRDVLSHTVQCERDPIREGQNASAANARVQDDGERVHRKVLGINVVVAPGQREVRLGRILAAWVRAADRGPYEPLGIDVVDH